MISKELVFREEYDSLWTFLVIMKYCIIFPQNSKCEREIAAK